MPDFRYYRILLDCYYVFTVDGWFSKPVVRIPERNLRLLDTGIILRPVVYSQEEKNLLARNAPTFTAEFIG